MMIKVGIEDRSFFCPFYFLSSSMWQVPISFGFSLTNSSVVDLGRKLKSHPQSCISSFQQ
jgi:hypothetical protein